MKYPLKLIEWEDAFAGEIVWFNPESLPEQSPLITTTVGFEIQRTERYITLVQSCNSEGRCGAAISIPLGMIRREKTLRARL